MDEIAKNLRKKLSGILFSLNEKQRRLLVGAEAQAIGYGGIKIASDATGIDCKTIRRGIQELKQKKEQISQVRKKGGGRKKIKDQNPEIIQIIEDLIEPHTRGDPESPLRWTCKSVRNIEDFLQSKGYDISYKTVSSILHDLEYSLQGNKKTKEGKDHVDRDAQFKYINKIVKKFLKIQNPVISVDTKKKELIGNYKNPGREWAAKGSPKEVNDHDFPDPKVSKAVPYGVYDIGDNSGWVNVGISADTAEFAVESIQYWWKHIGQKRYSNANKILICADAGGSNSYRSRLWKKKLQDFCNKEKIEVSVCHFPPGTSKWNKIEHRLFSFISINWRGKPLLTYQTVINLIMATKTKSGLSVKARLSKKTYKKGVKVSKLEMESLNIHKHKFHGEWNYTIKPKNTHS
jgi:transposase